MSKIERIVLHIPHASPVLPFGRSGWEEGIDEEIVRWTDWYTDWLFASASRLDARIIPVSYPFSRFFCDVERLEDDPLEAVGQGIIYERFGSLRRTVAVEEREFAMQSYREHQDRLRRAITGKDTLLVDCHSFPSELSDVNICIGINEDWSRPEDWMQETVLGQLRERGYRTEINVPYSNSVNPDCVFRYRSFMIEVNKDLYLDDGNGLRTEQAEMLRSALEELFQSLL